MTLLATLLLLVATGLFTACSNDDTNTTPNDAKGSEISFKINAEKVMEGTRATTFDSTSDLHSESFMCAAYNENTTEAYLGPVNVTWDGSRWAFADGSHQWPVGNLDFFAYMPSTSTPSDPPTPPSYISGVTYTATASPSETHNVTFTCTDLPMTYNSGSPTAGQGSSLKEFVYAMALGQNRTDNIGGVNLVFQHPFARIKLQLSASHPDVTINSITFRNIKNNGSFTYDHSASTSTWVPSGVATDFLLTFTGGAAIFNDNPVSPRQIGDYYIMIPQNWAGEIVVDADCLFWGEKVRYPSLTTTVPTTWQPGYSYTYTFNISPDDLKVNISRYTEQW